MLRRQPHADRGTQRQAGDMSFLDAECLHKSSNIVGEILGGVGAFRLVTLAGSAQIKRNAGEMLGIFSDLEGITRVISAQIGNQYQRFARPLLLVMKTDVVGFDLWQDDLQAGALTPLRHESLEGTRTSLRSVPHCVSFQECCQLYFGLASACHIRWPHDFNGLASSPAMLPKAK